jgi:ABC-type glycerol-3-phosphate transport system permease component
MVTTSLKTKAEIFSYPITLLPAVPQWHHYVELFTAQPFLQYILNTLLYTVIGVIGSLVGSSCAAFAFARMRFRLRGPAFAVMMATVMIPSWVTLIPAYIMFSRIGWLDTYLPLLVPAFFAAPVNTFLLRQFFRSIPKEIEEAARIDGAGNLRFFFMILLPLSKSALLVIAIFSFVFYWNDFMGPLIYLTSQGKFPIQLGILNFVGENTQDYALMMAGATLAILPCVVLFFIAQRWFIQGIVITGVKG